MILSRFFKVAISSFFIFGFLFIVLFQSRFNYGCRTTVKSPLVKDAVIAYLVHGSRITELIQSLRSLEIYFLMNYPYPVILFSDTLESESLIRGQCSTFLNGLLQFRMIQLEFPTNFIPPVGPVPFQDRYPGYQHMIRFWWRNIFYHPDIHSKLWYWRMDTDSFLKEPVLVDPFLLMTIEKKLYGYRALDYDPDLVVHGLRNFTRNYIQSGNVKTALQLPTEEDENGLSTFYNNFEIVHIPRFLAKDVQDYVEAVDQSFQIYHARWGDAALRYLLVKMLLHPSETVHFCWLNYQHGKYLFPPDCALPKINPYFKWTAE